VRIELRSILLPQFFLADEIFSLTSLYTRWENIHLRLLDFVSVFQKDSELANFIWAPRRGTSRTANRYKFGSLSKGKGGEVKWNFSRD